ncbi:MAG: hypothetical protein ACM31L_07460 [Actinomycetota bacterium]
MELWITCAAVFAAGAFVGWGELVSRYRDNPMSMLDKRPAAWLYMVVNGAASVGALFAIRAMKIDGFGDDNLFGQAMLAGFGGMAFFRSSLFTARVGNADVAIGPAHVLQQVLGCVDSALDRFNGLLRLKESAAVMQGVDFQVAVANLPLLCFNAMEQITDDQKKEITDAITQVTSDAGASAQAKAVALGQILHEAVGIDVLRAAVETLGKIQSSAPAKIPADAPAKEKETV